MPTKKLATSPKTPEKKAAPETKKRSSARWTSKKLAVTIARLTEDKQADAIVVLDVAQAFQIADYFVICTGASPRQLRTISEHVARELKQEGIYRMAGTPMTDEQWVCLDFGPVVLHCFSTKAREYYDLDNHWGDCDRVRWRLAGAKKKAAAAAPAAVRPSSLEDDVPEPTPPGYYSGPDTPESDADADATA